MVQWCIITGEVIDMATAKPRYTVSVDNVMFQKIENFRFERRFQSRSEATAELIRLGLEALTQEKTEKNPAEDPAGD